MILSKTILQHRSIVLTSIKHFKIQSCNLHLLSAGSHLRASTRALSTPKINLLITRFETSDTSIKDKILNLPEENKSVDASVSTNDSLPDISIPDASVSLDADIPNLVTEVALSLNKLGEPSLQSYGLGSYYTPVGWVQNLLEFLHCTFEIPWWGAISLSIIMARILLFPLVIKNQRSSIRMHNTMPKIQKLQMQMNHARTYGNHVEAMKIGMELAKVMKEGGVNPGSTMLMPVVQAPIFLSFFLGIRAMANTPVESMATGGLLWFADLTVSDPFYILPAATSATLFLALKVGVDISTMPTSSTLSRFMPYMLGAVPLVLFPFMMYFPSGVCVYWATANFISLVQVLFLRLPKIRTYFGIDTKIKHDKTKNPKQKDNFVKGLTNAWGNMKIAREIEERERLDQISFTRAGRAPPAKTFKENPLLKEQAFENKKN